MKDNRETSHALKRQEKIGLKLRLGKCGELKFVLTFAFFSFQIFSNCFENLIVSFHMKVTKIAIFMKKKKKKLKLLNGHGGMGTLPFPPRTQFFPTT